MQKAGIPLGRKHFRHIRVSAFFEYHSVKHAVEQVAQSTCIDQCSTNNKPLAVFLLNDLEQIPGTKDDSSQSKKSKQHLTPFAPKFPAPGHSLILNKIKLKPFYTSRSTINNWSCNFSISKRITGFDPYLQCLVGYDNEYNNENSIS